MAVQVDIALHRAGDLGAHRLGRLGRVALGALGGFAAAEIAFVEGHFAVAANVHIDASALLLRRLFILPAVEMLAG